MIKDINTFLKNNDNKIKNSLGLFKIGTQLGQGGTSIVKECCIEGIDKTYVIKFLLENISTNEFSKYKRFKQAYINLISLKSNLFIIPQIHFDNIKINENLVIPYIIMHKADKGKLEIATDFEDFEKKANGLLDAVDYIHKNGIIHRDLKPENIFIYNGRIVLADFDISKFDENIFIKLHKTEKKEKLANYYYSAPEQKIKGGIVDEKSDFFAFGQILYYLIMGTPLIGQKNIDFSIKGDKYKKYETLVRKLISEDISNRFKNKEEISNFLTKNNEINKRNEQNNSFLTKEENLLYLFLEIINKYSTDKSNGFTHLKNKSDIKKILYDLNGIIGKNNSPLWWKKYQYKEKYKYVLLLDSEINKKTSKQNKFLDSIIGNNFYNIGNKILNIKSLYLYKQEALEGDNFIIIEINKPKNNFLEKHINEEFCIYDNKHKISRIEYDNGFAKINGKIIKLDRNKTSLFTKDIENDIYFIGPGNLFETRNNKPIFEKFYKNYILNGRKINNDFFNDFDYLRRYKPWEKIY